MTRLRTSTKDFHLALDVYDIFDGALDTNRDAAHVERSNRRTS